MEKTDIITKTNFTCGDDCPLATVYSMRNPEEASDSDINYILDNGLKVGEFARKLFPDGVTVEYGYRSSMAKATRELLENGVQTIFEASFLHDGLFAAIDILQVYPNNHLRLLEVKSATNIKDIFYRDLAFQVNLVNSCGYVVDSAYLVTINDNFVKDGDINPFDYFIFNEVTDDVYNLVSSIDLEISQIRQMLNNGGPFNPLFGDHCFSPYLCQFWNKCKTVLPKKTIFDIKGMRTSTKLKHFNDGIQDLRSFLDLKGQNRKYVQQARLEVEEDDTLEVKTEDLKAFLETLQYPLISLDFETIMPAIPIFDGMKPYGQIVTQFSMHVINNVDSNIEHYEFLANPNEDWRKKLAHKLVENCPKEGSVIVWNKTMEYHRIVEMAEMECNIDIYNELMSIADRIVDLMVPFKNRTVYNRAMKGSYSLKYVLPALCPNRKDLNYSGLLINNGMLASMAFTQMMESKMSDIQIASTRHDLLTYCELDTYGPLCILDVLFGIIGASRLNLKILKHDYANRTLHVGDRVSTNVGLGTVTGFTRCFVKVLCNNRISIRRKPYNLCNLSNIEIPGSGVISKGIVIEKFLSFYDVTGRRVNEGDFVVTNSKFGKVIGHTSRFIKIMLSDGTIVLRNGNFTIVR